MKIFIKKDNNVVIYAGDYELTKNGLFGKNFFDPTLTIENALVENVNSLPENFRGGFWKFENSEWKENEAAKRIIENLRKKTRIPKDITRLQALVILEKYNLLDSIEEKISQMDKITQIAWREASVFERNSPLLNEMANQLNLTQNFLDNLFFEASKIKV